MAAAMLLLLALPSAQLSVSGIVYLDTCCCGDIGPCPCPEHNGPHDDDSPTMRSCGNSGSVISSPGLPSFDLPQVATIAIAVRRAPPLVARLAQPHPAPDAEPPTVPI
jgi:hypothetical protein